MFHLLDGALEVHVKLIVFEPAGIAHTGNVEAEITTDEYDRLDLWRDRSQPKVGFV